MKFKQNIKIKQIGDEHILVSTDSGHINFTRVITLNASAEYLIHTSLDKEFSIADWAEMLSAKYGISQEQALTDVKKLVEKLNKAEVLA